MKNKKLLSPLIIFVTDRKTLDEQLHKEFASLPVVDRADSIIDLQWKIKNMSAGIIFTTIEKFGKNKHQDYPLLTSRNNIIVVCDEAHRSQYREFASNLRKGIPNAVFLGFTATPIEYADRSTSLVFGDHISIYSLGKALRDNVVVPLAYEPRLTELYLTDLFIDEKFEDIAEFVEPNAKEELKSKYAKLEKLVLTPKRIRNIAKDIVEHFNKRSEELKGKAIIVAFNRKVAVALYNEIMKNNNAPSVFVVMSGNRHDDPREWWPHLRTRSEMEELEETFPDLTKDPQIAIVVDMWLTGFDVPCLNTIYIDRPMKDHALIQAVTRVNRTYKDKPGGLIVDYIGIADNLKKSYIRYAGGASGPTCPDISVDEMYKKYFEVCSFFKTTNYKKWKVLSKEDLSRLTVMAYDTLSEEKEERVKFVKSFVALKRLHALAGHRAESSDIKNEIEFFEMIKKMIVKYSTSKIKDINRELEYEINDLISGSIIAAEPVDLLALVGKEKIDISILDEQFLEKFKDIQFKNYAAELLAKITKDELVVKMKSNPTRFLSLYESFNRLIERYNTKLLTAPDIIEELVSLAKELKRQIESGKKLNPRPLLRTRVLFPKFFVQF